MRKDFGEFEADMSGKLADVRFNFSYTSWEREEWFNSLYFTMHSFVLKYASLVKLLYWSQVEQKLKESANSSKFHQDRVRELEEKLASMERVCSCPYLIYKLYRHINVYWYLFCLFRSCCQIRMQLQLLSSVPRLKFQQ